MNQSGTKVDFGQAVLDMEDDILARIAYGRTKAQEVFSEYEKEYQKKYHRPWAWSKQQNGNDEGRKSWEKTQ